MRVCPKWCLALEEHQFWRAAISLFDPFNMYAACAWVIPPHSHSNSASAAGVPATPYRHFHTIYVAACLACRINAPLTHAGVGTARKLLETPRLGHVYLCKEHMSPRRGRWCEVCFKDLEIVRHFRRDAVHNAREELARAEQRLDVCRQWSLVSSEEIRTAQTARLDAYNALKAAQQAVEDALNPSLDGHIHPSLDEEGDEGVMVFGCAWAICRPCRAEWVWRCAAINSGIARDRETMQQGRPFTAGVDPLDWSVGTHREPASTLGLGQRVATFSPVDSTVRDTLKMYVEFGEGSIGGVLQQAEERGWLRAQTKWSEMMGMVLAARGWEGEGEPELHRTQRERSPSPEAREPAATATQKTSVNANLGPASWPLLENGQLDLDKLDLMQLAEPEEQPRQWAGKTVTLQEVARSRSESPLDGYSEDYSDSEELDLEIEMAVEEEMNVRELALGDWARGRILDGSWVTPADVYYLVRVKRGEHPDIGIRATHPVPWTISPPPSPPHDPAAPTRAPARHPGTPGPPVPTALLADVAHTAHVRQLRTVLLPPMRNVVRRLVMECALDAGEMDLEEKKVVDPAIRAARMSLEDVVRELREEEGVWFEGVDWSERRRNAKAEAQEEIRRRRRTEEDTSSDGSGTTPGKTESPALSTSTLGTTPSPPPPGERYSKEPKSVDFGSRPPAIAVDPVQNPPRLLHSIAYVPETIAHLPMYSLEALRQVWREACAPLYHCRCSICVRAAQEQSRAADALLAQAAPVPVPAVAPTTTATAREQREWADREHAKGGSEPWVVQIPEEDGEREQQGVESVVSVVEEPAYDSEVLDRDAPLWEGAIDYEEEEEEFEEDLTSISDHSDLDDAYAYESRPGPKQKLVLLPAGTIQSQSRKRSVDELTAPAPVRGGSPPKRARTKEPPVIKIAGAGMRSPVKRRSEELELDDGSDASSAGSGNTKRARIDGS
ncbi:hypothetical protein C8F01DRAFT_447417 [Mycena amicta]|nr:hypothetical protein C8F01DRAFT_447417 [Mycena amicta]